MDRVCTGQQGVWWAREELNLRPLPCQQNTGNRCATRRSPRSAPTVDAEGKRSLGVQLNALFRYLDSTAAARIAPLPAFNFGPASATSPITEYLRAIEEPDDGTKPAERPASRLKVTKENL